MNEQTYQEIESKSRGTSGTDFIKNIDQTSTIIIFVVTILAIIIFKSTPSLKDINSSLIILAGILVWVIITWSKSEKEIMFPSDEECRVALNKRLRYYQIHYSGEGWDIPMGKIEIGECNVDEYEIEKTIVKVFSVIIRTNTGYPYYYHATMDKNLDLRGWTKGEYTGERLKIGGNPLDKK